ncbi:DUF3090 family protein [Candidatus Neomicrothrix sp.]|jgi:uncharacterized repeat protein (TIGR03847 family)|uniref:DUF3090 family protein n=1 Tax=Candidatus Neomicrothrix sp. TaxID=2719034 RepID=UPI001B468736|nr:DUF3090 family protein [Candidatus Microthrix sp.]MBP7597132.1 DUF3090 family protein [Candidatus Microthrix sp.]HMS47283.1 DUF3090 family protein [Candidatus Microthrix sp.]
MSDEFEMFDQPDDFLPGSVGEPGNRVFYMQARDGHRVTSLRCEKEQVLALAQFLMRLVGDDGPVEPLGELIEPVTESFVVGNLLVSAEDADGSVVVVAEELVFVDEDDDGLFLDEPSFDDAATEPRELRIRMSAAAARGFAQRAGRLMAGSRPICELCGRPIDPDGHACPRLN